MNLYTCKICFKSLERGQKTVDDLQELVTACRQYFGMPTASIKVAEPDQFGNDESSENVHTDSANPEGK